MPAQSQQRLMAPEYIAGFFDGEGYITMRRCNRKINKHPSYSVVIGFTNTDLQILMDIRQSVGGVVYPKSRKSSKHSAAYELTLFRKDDVVKFIETIGPFVRVKAAQIALIQQFISLPKSKRIYVGRGKTWPLIEADPADVAIREDFKLRLTALNKRGPICLQ